MIQKMPMSSSGGAVEVYGAWTQYRHSVGYGGCVDTLATNEECKILCYSTSHSVDNEYFTITRVNSTSAGSVTITAKKSCTLLQENYNITNQTQASAPLTPTSTSTLSITAGNTYTINALNSETFEIKWIVQ